MDIYGSARSKIQDIARKDFAEGDYDQNVGLRVMYRRETGPRVDGCRLEEWQRKASRFGPDGRGLYRRAPPNRTGLSRHNESDIVRGVIQCVERRNRPLVISEKDHSQGEG